MGHLGFASLVRIQNKAKLCLSASLGEARFCTSPELENTWKFPWGKKELVVLSKTSSKLENSISSLTIRLQTCKFTCSSLNVQPPPLFFPLFLFTQPVKMLKPKLFICNTAIPVLLTRGTRWRWSLLHSETGSLICMREAHAGLMELAVINATRARCVQLRGTVHPQHGTR